MNTNSKDKDTPGNYLQELLVPATEQEKIELEARMIQLDFIARLQEIMKAKGIRNKKELASLLGTSPSFITQLFSAEKLINLKHLAKLQRALDLKYSIISDQYLRLKNRFRENLAVKGFREMKISPVPAEDNPEKIA